MADYNITAPEIVVRPLGPSGEDHQIIPATEQSGQPADNIGSA
jgi:hypothetical protein